MRNFNATSILWTHKDINLIYEDIKGFIQDSFEISWSEKDIQSSIEKLDYLSRLLQTLQLRAPSALLKEVHDSLLFFKDHKETLAEEKQVKIKELIIEAILPIPDLLEYLSEGHKDIPELVVPFINKLRDIRGQKHINPSELFTPDTLIDTSFLPVSDIPEKDVSQKIQYLSVIFQNAMVNWAKNEDPQISLRSMSSVCQQMYKIVKNEDYRKLFWVAENMFMAIAAGEFSCSTHCRHAVAKIEKSITSLAEGKEYPTEDLLRQILFYISQEGKNSEILEEVSMMFGLESFMYDESDLHLAEAFLAGRNKNVMNIVASGLRDNIYQVKDIIDIYLRTKTGLDAVKEQSKKLSVIESTLNMLVMPEEAAIAAQQQKILFDIISDLEKQGLTEELREKIIDVASDIISIDTGISNKIADQSSDVVTNSSLKSTVITESISLLEKTKQEVIATANTGENKISSAKAYTEQVSSAILVLGDVGAYPYFDKMAKLFSWVVNQGVTLKGEQLEATADIVVCLSYYLEAIRDHQPDPHRILQESRNGFLVFGSEWDPSPVLAMHDSDNKDKDASRTGSSIKEKEEQDLVYDQSTIISPSESTALSSETISGQKEQELHPVGSIVVAFDGKSQDIVDDEIREIFIEEIEEEIQSIVKNIDLLKGGTPKAALSDLRKSFHTIKGSGRMAGAATLGDLAYSVEYVLTKSLDGSLDISPNVLKVAPEGLKLLEIFMRAVKGEVVRWQPEVFMDWVNKVSRGVSADLVYKTSASPASSYPTQQEESSNTQVLEVFQDYAPSVEQEKIEVLPQELSSLDISSTDHATSFVGMSPIGDAQEHNKNDNVQSPEKSSQDKEIPVHNDFVSHDLELDSIDFKNPNDAISVEIFDFNSGSALLNTKDDENNFAENLELVSPDLKTSLDLENLFDSVSDPTLRGNEESTQVEELLISIDDGDDGDDSGLAIFSIEGSVEPIHKDIFDDMTSLKIEDEYDADQNIINTAHASSSINQGSAHSEEEMALDIPSLGGDENKKEKEKEEKIKFDFSNLELVSYDAKSPVSAPSPPAPTAFPAENKNENLSWSINDDKQIEREVSGVIASAPVSVEEALPLNVDMEREDVSVNDHPSLFNDSLKVSAVQSEEELKLDPSSPKEIFQQETVVASDKKPAEDFLAEPPKINKKEVFFPLVDFEDLPSVKTIKGDWKEYISILMEHNEVMDNWAAAMEAQNPQPINPAAVDLVVRLKGFHKRVQFLLNKATESMTEVEGRVIKEEIRSIVEPVPTRPAPAPVAPPVPTVPQVKVPAPNPQAKSSSAPRPLDPVAIKKEKVSWWRRVFKK